MKFSNMGVHSKEFYFNVNQNCNAFTYTCGIISNVCYECQFFDGLLICIAMILNMSVFSMVVKASVEQTVVPYLALMN